MTKNRESIFQEIHDERERQDAKRGEQNHPVRDEEMASEFEQAAKTAKWACDVLSSAGCVTWHNILFEECCEVFAESDPARQREELIQVAAVAISIIECIDRKAGQV